MILNSVHHGLMPSGIMGNRVLKSNFGGNNIARRFPLTRQPVYSGMQDQVKGAKNMYQLQVQNENKAKVAALISK